MNATDQWDTCPSGELKKIVRRIKGQRRDKAVAKVIAATSAVVFLVLLGGVIAQQLHRPSESNFGNIACSEVMSHLPDFMAGNLDVQLASKIRTHLDECPKCGPMYQKMISQMGAAQHAHDDLSSCSCPHCSHHSAIAMLDRRDR